MLVTDGALLSCVDPCSSACVCNGVLSGSLAADGSLISWFEMLMVENNVEVRPCRPSVQSAS